MSSVEKPSDSLLAEYAAANDAYMHYDNFSWQVGAILIAGAFVFWGFLIDKNIDPWPFAASSVLVTALMSIWMLYSSHNRQIYLCKLHRLHEIEATFGFEQHRRWIVAGDDSQPIYRTFGLGGHILDIFTYAVASLGAPIIAIAKTAPHIAKTALYIGSGLSVLMVVIVISWTRRNERALKRHLKRGVQEKDTDQKAGTE